MVLGAGLYAANLSTTFKLRKFRMSDGVTYPVVFQVRPRRLFSQQPLQVAQQSVRSASRAARMIARLTALMLVMDVYFGKLRVALWQPLLPQCSQRVVSRMLVLCFPESTLASLDVAVG